MSAVTQSPTPTPDPDPDRADADTPTRLGRVLRLVRKLIDYGKQRRGPGIQALPARRARPRPHAVAYPLPAPRSGRKTAPPDAQPEPQPADRAEVPVLAAPAHGGRHPAAEVRRRPVGAVILDICLDLGIAPCDLDRAFWDELRWAIVMYGGSAVTWLVNLRRQRVKFADLPDDVDPGWPAAPLRLTAAATGPP